MAPFEFNSLIRKRKEKLFDFSEAIVAVPPRTFETIWSDVRAVLQASELKKYGINAFKWHGFDVVSHPIVPKDEVWFQQPDGTTFIFKLK